MGQRNSISDPDGIGLKHTFGTKNTLSVRSGQSSLNETEVFVNKQEEFVK